MVSDPRSEYSQRLTRYESVAAAKNRLHIRIGNTKLAVVGLGLLLAYLGLVQHRVSAAWLLAPIALYLVLAVIHELVLREHHRAETAASYYKKGLARIDDRWP